MNKRRSPINAVLLNVFSGLGHIYCGQFRRWLILFFGPAIICLCSFVILFQLTDLFWAPVLLYLGVYLLFFAALVDAFFIARKSQDYQLRWFNKWYCYLLYTFLILNLNVRVGIYIRDNFIQAFKLPAASMMPTLHIGDHLLTDRRVYRNHKPIRGDIIVFRFPKDESKDFIKRVIGIPGDTIEIKDRVLYINGDKQDESYINRGEDAVSSRLITVRDNFGPVTVPENSYFALGDNRDHSLDSRFWGFVPESNLKGKLKHIYFSIDKKRKIHWDRIGRHFP